MRRLRRRPSAGLFVFTLLLAGCQASRQPSSKAAYEHACRLLQSEHFEEALAAADQALAATPDESQLAWNFRLLRAEVLLAKREAKRVSAVLKEAPPNKPGFTLQMARYRLCQGHLAVLLHDLSTARIRLDQAQAFAAALPPSRLGAEIALRRVSLDIATGDFDGAKRHLNQVLGYADARKDGALRLSATGSMGYLLSHQDECDRAIPWFKQAAEQARLLGAKTSEGRAIGNLGFCFFDLGDREKALLNFREAEARFAAIGNRFERQVWLGNIGNIEEVNQQYEAAAADYAQALAISRELGDSYWTALWLNDLAVVYTELERWDAAERCNNEAMALQDQAGDEKSHSYSLLNAAMIAVGRGEDVQAEKIFRSVLLLKPQDVRQLLSVHGGLAQAYAAQHRDRAAEGEFRAAVDVMARQQAGLLDEKNKLTWFASVIRLYQDYVEFLMSRGKTLDALEVAHSSRGRLLTARLDQTDSRTRLTAEALRRVAAQSGSTLLLYFIGQHKSYGWAIASSGITHFDLPGQTDLQRLVNGYDSFIQQLHDPLREASSMGRKLYETLVEPAHVKSGRVLLAPDGPLYSLNFATLPVPDLETNRYWLEDVQLSIVPSFDLAREDAPRGAPSLLLIGDPVAADEQFPELAFAGQEIIDIQRRLPGVRQVVYTRGQACPKSYAKSKPGEFSWIHFVAHATANQDEPLQSAVILSRDDEANYRLLARDVVQISLRAELVTISGCRSAGARIYAGEGLVGFSWAFLKSGARNVVAGLWDVNDRSTAETMSAMYGELGKGALPAEALRTAQLSLMHSAGVYRKPYYWGPFEVFTAAGRR